MEIKKINLSNSTEYPNIYCNTYWGKSCEDQNMDQIIKNRNDFIKTYNIKKIKKLKFIKQYLDKLEKGKKIHLDHVEVYETNDKKFIIVNSPYWCEDDEMIKEGFTRIYDLYRHGALTYLKYIERATNKDYLKTFYEKLENKERICDICGQMYTYARRSQHEKSKIHNILKKRFEHV